MILLGNARTLALYSKVFDQGPAVSGRKYRRIEAMKKAPETESEKPRLRMPAINFFAGPHCVFDPTVR